MTNPFAQSAPTNETAQQQAPANPFGPSVAQQAPSATPAQQQYAPPATPAYAPPAQQYATAAPQAYTQQPQQQYAPPAPQAPTGQYAGPALDMAGLAAAAPPPPVGDGNGPKLADMYSRLVLVFPHTITTRPRNPQYITPEQRAQGRLTEELVTATVVVLDMGPGTSPSGGYIDFGGAPHELPPRPHTDRAALPFVRKAMWITQSRLVEQLRPHVPANNGGSQGMVAGRVVKAGPERNAPWYLEAASEDELALCRTYLGLVTQGQYPHPLA